MKLTDTQDSTLRTKFPQLQSKEDLLNLINEVGYWIYGDKSSPFKLKQLTWYANPSMGGERYFEFQIKKKSGSERSIHAPIEGLKSIQRILNIILQSVFQSHPAATGFVSDKSIVDNAKTHINQRYVYNLDLKDFFPSIEQARVWRVLQLPPFNLNKETSSELYSMPWEEFKTQILKSGEVSFSKYTNTYVSEIIMDEDDTPDSSNPFFEIFIPFRAKKYLIKLFAPGSIHPDKPMYVFQKSYTYTFGKENQPQKVAWLVNEVPTIGKVEIANVIAGICCTQLEVERKDQEGNWIKVFRNALPQGAPTSPTITNIICKKMDHRLSGVAKRFGLRYTRYADDITFSSMHNVYQVGSEFIKEIQRIISDQGFEIKSSKTRLQKDGFRKEVTGLTVNEKVNVSKRYIKQIRMWLYYWEKYGYNRADSFFLPYYLKDKGHLLKGRPDMKSVIEGKLNYLKMVVGETPMFSKLEIRFNKLAGIQSKPALNSREVLLEEVIDLLFEQGLNRAMEFYDKNN
jgi:retron-type reverse transcriptase